MQDSQTKGYQGWANYPTWCVNLWLGNDEGLYNTAMDMARESIEEADGHDLDDAAGDLAKTLSDWVESFPAIEQVTESASFASDLMTYALQEVDWYEISEHWVNDAREDMDLS